MNTIDNISDGYGTAAGYGNGMKTVCLSDVYIHITRSTTITKPKRIM